MNDYPLIKVNKNTAEVPSDAPIEKLRFSTSWYGTAWGYYSDYAGRVSTKGLKSLAEQGVERVGDLEGWSVDGLKDLPGIGEITAKRLIGTAEKASIDYRGTGFPWQVTVVVEVPQKYVKDVLKIGRDNVKEILIRKLSDSEFLSDLSKQAASLQLESLEQEQKRIIKKLEEIKSQKKELVVV